MVSQEFAEIWAASDHPFTHTLTTQVKPARNVFMEAAMTRVFGELGVVGITQVVSDSGVENWQSAWPAQAVYREGVTSVNFSANVIEGGVRGRLVLNFQVRWPWILALASSYRRSRPESSDPISTTCVVYDERDGRVVHAHEFVGDGTGLFGKDGEGERWRMALETARQHDDSSHLQTLNAPSDFRIEPDKIYRVEPSTRRLLPREHHRDD